MNLDGRSVAWFRTCGSNHHENVSSAEGAPRWSVPHLRSCAINRESDKGSGGFKQGRSDVDQRMITIRSSLARDLAFMQVTRLCNKLHMDLLGDLPFYLFDWHIWDLH